MKSQELSLFPWILKNSALRLGYLEDAKNFRRKHFPVFAWQMPDTYPRPFQRISKVKSIFVVILRCICHFFFLVITQWDFPQATRYCDNMCVEGRFRKILKRLTKMLNNATLSTNLIFVLENIKLFF